MAVTSVVRPQEIPTVSHMLHRDKVPKNCMIPMAVEDVHQNSMLSHKTVLLSCAPYKAPSRVSSTGYNERKGTKARLVLAMSRSTSGSLERIQPSL